MNIVPLSLPTNEKVGVQDRMRKLSGQCVVSVDSGDFSVLRPDLGIRHEALEYNHGHEGQRVPRSFKSSWRFLMESLLCVSPRMDNLDCPTLLYIDVLDATPSDKPESPYAVVRNPCRTAQDPDREKNSYPIRTHITNAIRRFWSNIKGPGMARELSQQDLELHHEIYEPFARYLHRLLEGEDPCTISIGTYSSSNGRLFRTLPGGRLVRVPTSFDEAEQLVRKIHVELDHMGVRDLTAAVRERLFVQ